MRIRSFLATASAVALGLVAISANADPLAADGKEVYADFVNVNPQVGMSYDLTTPPSYSFSGGTQAGVFNWTRFTNAGNNNDYTGTDLPLRTDTNRNFTTFCIQLNQYLTDPQVFTVVDDLKDAPIGGNGTAIMGQNKALALANLWAAYGSVATNNTDDVSYVGNAAQEAAAFQVAVWEIVWEDWTLSGDTPVGLNVQTKNGGSATSTIGLSFTGDSTVLALATSFLSSVSLSSSADYADLKGLVTENAQDQAFYVGTGGNPVPLPAAAPAVLACLGLAGLTARRRRK